MHLLLIEPFSSISTVDLITKIIYSVIQVPLEMSHFFNSALVEVQRVPPYICATSNSKVLSASQNSDISSCDFFLGLTLYLMQFLAACLLSMLEKCRYRDCFLHIIYINCPFLTRENRARVNFFTSHVKLCYS